MRGTRGDDLTAGGGVRSAARPDGWIGRVCAACLAGLLGAGGAGGAARTALAADGAVDPLHSPAWPFMLQRFFKGQDVRFDERVRVSAPANAEDALNVPVTVDAGALEGVEEIVVIADLNPIQRILSLHPTRAAPGLSFRFKVEQSTPIRAAARTRDGVWHVGGVWLNAAGGGCTTPSGASRGLWQGQVGAMNGRLWPRGAGERLRLRVVHPMDTGLASAIPAFYMDHLVVRDSAGAELAVLDAYEPLSENPVISIDLRDPVDVRVDGHDIQGNRFAADIRR